jgi:hypothetical protein
MIYETNESFDFGSTIRFISPKSIAGGNYFIKCQNPGNQPLYIQTPKCKSKQKIMKTGKKMYCDLVFSQDDESFLKWIEDFEAFCQKKLFDNRAEWFDSELEMHDIENSFAASLKIYKSGKQHVLRANIPVRLEKSTLKIYDEQEQVVDSDTIMENTNLITILEIQGIRCSSRSFQLEYEIKQMLVLNPVDIFEKCILLPKKTNVSVEKTPENNHLAEGTLGLAEGTKGTIGLADTDLAENKKEVLAEGTEGTKGTLGLAENKKEDIAFGTKGTIGLAESKNDDSNPEKADLKIEEKDLGIQLEEKDLEAIDLILPEDSETIQLKKRNEVYFEMYKDAKRKAKMAREFALAAYLEAKRIKNTYLIDEAFNSDEEDDDNSSGDKIEE